MTGEVEERRGERAAEDSIEAREGGQPPVGPGNDPPLAFRCDDAGYVGPGMRGNRPYVFISCVRVSLGDAWAVTFDDPCEIERAVGADSSTCGQLVGIKIPPPRRRARDPQPG